MHTLFFKIGLMGQSTLLQVPGGLEEAAGTSPLNAALVAFIVILLGGIGILWRQSDITRKELKELNTSHAKSLEENKKDYIEKFEKLQNEYLNREEERNRQWSDSEKETLQVLNGVTSILEMSEKMGQKDTKEILEKLKTVEERIITTINNKK